jgi:hypothetical protein
MAGAPSFESLDGAVLGVTAAIREERGKVEFVGERLFGRLFVTAVLLRFPEGAHGTNTYGGRMMPSASQIFLLYRASLGGCGEGSLLFAYMPASLTPTPH